MLLWLKCIYVRVFYLTNFVHVRFRWFEKLFKTACERAFYFLGDTIAPRG